MKLFDVRVPFFRPLWRRVAVTGLTLGWAGVEVWAGAPGWAALFGAAGLYLLYEFFVVYDPANYRDREDRR